MSIETNEMVFCKSGGTITSGGFKINNKALSNGSSAVIPINDKDKKIEKVSDIFNNLAIPAGLFYMKQELEQNFIKNKTNEVVPAELYAKLINLAENSQKKISRKNKKKPSKKKTKRNYRFS